MTSGAEYLRERGYSAQPQTTDAVSYGADCRSALPHKTVAVSAGLGWVGKSCLLVTPEYGSAVRISSLLTDAPLSCASSEKEPLCGGCGLCRSSCPAQALSGLAWSRVVDRDLLVDTERCARKQRELMMARTGINTDLCGRCFAVCPYTEKYLSAASK
ncbi:MAG: 4Fe-4S dicluster domain-containing protein [Synergistaceae bacterium]|nr:4Fe-4S dicluster domain-containing protein [Synergistaceae bacterium]